MFPQIFGKYVLERELAAGGMARVYEAKLRGAVGFEKRLVVKQIRPELASDSAFVDRFVDEAKTAVELSHPNIVPVYELGVEQGVYYIAMELCEGATLGEILRETGPLSPEEGAFLGAEICRGLDYAHRRVGIVHRDVTPRNVLVDEEGAVRVIDFGIAAPSQDAAGPASAHRHEILGSPGHMPPEQLAGDDLGPETDVFAVGALLIEAWTGRPPFRRATAGESREALETPPPRVDDHDAALGPVAEVVACAVALDRSVRPESAESLARPLRELVQGVDTGDIARRLGDRARRARAAAERSTAWQDETSDDGSPTEGSSAVTRTFAAREEIEIASDSSSGGGGAASGPSTRKIASDRPPAADAEASGPSTRKIASDPPPAEPVERGSSAGSAREPEPATADASRSLLRPLMLVAAVGAVVYGLSLNDAAETDRREGDAVARTTASSPGPPPSPELADPPTRPEEVDDERNPPSPEPAPRRVPGAPSVAALAPSRSVERIPSPARADGRAPSARGTLRLTSQPPSRVTVAGRTFNRTPSIVDLAAGAHTVVFTFAATGEQVQLRVELPAGATRTVHADFEGATPSASVR